MKMHHRPAKLWFLALIIGLGIPLMALNISVYQKASVLRGFSLEGQRLLVVQSIFVLIAMQLILKGSWKAFWVFGITSGTMLWGNVYFLVNTKNYGLAFFALALLILSAFFSVHLYHTLKQVYYRSGCRWYE